MASMPDTVMATFLIFCRIGTCLMLVPGYSSTNIPPQIRLFIAFAITLAFTPIVSPTLQPLVHNAQTGEIVALICTELLIGSVIALAGRMFFLALQTMATAMAMAIGIGSMPGAPIDDMEAQPTLTPLITISATALFFVSNLHWEVLNGLAASYHVWRPADGLELRLALSQVSDRLSEAFVLALQVSSPFMIYTVVVNLAIGLANKLTPTIPVYFISLPFVLLGGLWLLYFTISEFLLRFMTAFATLAFG
jgi:flagellar biosynthesis protein FliR